MAILITILGIMVQFAIGYIVIKYAAKLAKWFYGQFVKPIIEAVFTIAFTLIKGFVCVTVGGVVVLVVVSIVANL